MRTYDMKTRDTYFPSFPQRSPSRAFLIKCHVCNGSPCWLAAASRFKVYVCLQRISDRCMRWTDQRDFQGALGKLETPSRSSVLVSGNLMSTVTVSFEVSPGKQVPFDASSFEV